MASSTSAAIDLTLSLKPSVLHEKLSDFSKHLSTIENPLDKLFEIITFSGSLKEEIPNMKVCRELLSTMLEQDGNKKSTGSSDGQHGTEQSFSYKNCGDDWTDIKPDIRNPNYDQFYEETNNGNMPIEKGYSDPRTEQPELVLNHRVSWSPLLKVKFRNAVEILGGAKDARPSGIHYLMQDDGVTYIQVKNQLQYYRKKEREAAGLSNKSMFKKTSRVCSSSKSKQRASLTLTKSNSAATRK